MKRILMLALTCAAVACAQGTTLTEVWRVEVQTRDWFTSDTSWVRSADYNSVTDKVTVVSRDRLVYGTDSFIEVDPATGVDVSTRSLVSGQVGHNSSFYVNKHAHDDVGVAYITNLTVNTDTTTFVIYRKATANDALTTAVEGNTAQLGLPAALRLGDTIDVGGSGNSTEIWVGTRNPLGPHLVKFTTTNGLTFTTSALLTVPSPLSGPWTESPSYGGLSVTGTGPGAIIWLNRSGIGPIRVNAVTGVVEDSINSAVFAGTSASIPVGYFETYGHKFVAVAPGAYVDMEPYKPGRVINVTEPANKSLAATTRTLRAGLLTNGNGTGSVAFDSGRKNVIFLTTNGVLGAYNMPASVTSAADWSMFE